MKRKSRVVELIHREVQLIYNQVQEYHITIYTELWTSMIFQAKQRPYIKYGSNVQALAAYKRVNRIEDKSV